MSGTGRAYHFRPARRSEAKPLIGLYAESGAGKTLSALYLARGFVGPTGRIGMIETESGRGEAYADILPGSYDVLPLRDDFSPMVLGEAIKAAEQAELGALIIDSASHEWEGAGGVLSMAADNEAAGKKGQLVWQKPKMDHQRYFMLRISGCAIPLVIVCMRAKYPMKQVNKPGGGKEWVRSDKLEPKQSEDILSELFVHGWIDAEHKFHGTKYTRDDLRPIIKDGEPISIESGRKLAEWAKCMEIVPVAQPDAQPSAVRAFLRIHAYINSMGPDRGGDKLLSTYCTVKGITATLDKLAVIRDPKKLAWLSSVNDAIGRDFDLAGMDAPGPIAERADSAPGHFPDEPMV